MFVQDREGEKATVEMLEVADLGERVSVASSTLASFRKV